MAVNRGKQFEDQISAAFEKIPNTSVTRLIDPQGGQAGVSNICDFIVYHYPTQFFIECKSCYGNTLSINSNNPKKKYGAISNKQWEGLEEMSKIEGVVAGYMIWFIDHDRTIFVPAQSMIVHKELGEKSYNIGKQWDSDYIEIKGKKKRVLFDYDMTDFIRKCTSSANPL
jgi:hypothetical protein